MSRDGRGTPGRIIVKDHQPRLKLADLLRRRRTTLQAFISDLGVTTYASLEIWCKRMGVAPPAPEEFTVAFPAAAKINSPMEGVIVLEAPPVVDAETGNDIDPEAPIEEPGVAVVTGIESQADPQKKARKKKAVQPIDP